MVLIRMLNQKNKLFYQKLFFIFFYRFWDERFLFECDDKSNQLHLQIIDHKKANKKSGNNYGLNISSF